MRKNPHALLICSLLLVACSGASPLEDGGDLATSPTAESENPDNAIPANNDIADNNGAPEPTLDCAPGAPTPGALALYAFEQTPLVDSAGDHAAIIEGDATNWSLTPGRTDCGNALRFNGQNDDSYVRVLDDSDWAQTEGSVDAWIYFEACPPEGEAPGLLSRDVTGETNGDMHALLLDDCSIEMRVQAEGSALGFDTFALDVTLATGTWHHFGVNWGAGGFEAWLDGNRELWVPATEGATAYPYADWLFGISEHAGQNSVYYPKDFAFDHIRISNVRRDFSGYTP